MLLDAVIFNVLIHKGGDGEWEGERQKAGQDRRTETFGRWRNTIGSQAYVPVAVCSRSARRSRM